MSQDTNHHQEQQHGLDQVPIPALPPVFAHVVISEHYEEGRFSSRLEAEIADILWNGQPVEEPEVGTNPSRQRRSVAAEPRQLANDASASTAAQSGAMQGVGSPLHFTHQT